jgi:hypothetical protein
VIGGLGARKTATIQFVIAMVAHTINERMT